MTRKDVIKGKKYTAEFHVSDDMVKRFIGLTGDNNALHTDAAFGRRSIYRRNIVHGALPLLFISALKPCRILNSEASFYGISAKFIKPVYVNDKLSIIAVVSENDREQNKVEFEYVLKKTETGTVSTTGKFILRYSRDAKDRKKITLKPGLRRLESSMIIDPVAENDLPMKRIREGDAVTFRFLISKDHASSLHAILMEGLSSECKTQLLNWGNNCNTANLLSTCLFSTFAGMFLPGKYATIIDFDARYNRQIEWGTNYMFEGRVECKSQLASVLVENILIRETGRPKKLCASGKINVMVNEPPIQMPSVDIIKKKESDMQLNGKVVLITGASRGIGETTAKLFSVHGAKVAVNYFQGVDDAKKIVDEINGSGGHAIGVQADVSDRQQVRQMLLVIREKYGTVNILVNNAARDYFPAPFAELVWADVQKDIDVTVKGAFNCCQEVLPLMVQNKSGKIINVSSVVAENPPPNQTKYVVSKSALMGLTRSLAVEYAPHNIQVNTVAPSMVETDMTKHIPKIFINEMRNNTPMGRNASPVDVARAIVFLASSLSSFTTGQKIMVTGGNPPLL